MPVDCSTKFTPQVYSIFDQGAVRLTNRSTDEKHTDQDVPLSLGGDAGGEKRGEPKWMATQL